MIKIGSAKALFDFDIVAGLIATIIVNYIWKYISTNHLTILETQPFGYGVSYSDFAVLATEAGIAIMTTGRIRKIFIYAFWFKIAMQVMESLMGIENIKLGVL